MNIKGINIREITTCTGGYCCDFYINNKKFRAEISSSFRPECIIFKYNEDGEINRRSGAYVYRNKNVTVNEISLLRCIKEFAEQSVDCDSKVE